MNVLSSSPAETQRRPAAGASEVSYLNPLDDPEWDRLVTSHPDAGVFHTAAWARVLTRTYRHRPFYLAFHQSGRLGALVPMMEVRSFITGRRGVCLPFADFCGPLFFEGCECRPVMDALTHLARERGWRHFEIRGGKKLESSATASVSFYSHTLDLRGGPEKLLAGLESPVRRAIKKADRSALTVEIRSDREAIMAYYRLHIRTRRRHGLPPQPLAFFLNIHEEIIRPGMGSVVLASSGSLPVAGAVFFHLGKRAVYKFGACDERVQELRANNSVMWTGIQSLAARGFESLHFGRTSRTQEGLRRYKLGWGAAESPLDYYKFAPQSAVWTKGRDIASGAHNALFSRFPLAFNRLLGAILYPHLD